MESRNIQDTSDNYTFLRDCTLCPRECHADRVTGQRGVCGQTSEIRAARAALHFWEEPCISGSRGSGAVFFSGCSLGCVFCQNHDISLGKTGQIIPPRRLAEIFLELQEQGAHNINLVTPTHFIPQIIDALHTAKEQGLAIPIVYNTGSYEKPETLRLLDGLVDIYLPDLKYFSPDLSMRFAHAADYFEKASAAIAEMFRQVGAPVLETQQEIKTVDFDIDTADATNAMDLADTADLTDSPRKPPLIKKGMIVRHLLLPGQTKDSKKILRYLHETYGNDIYVSIMNQYTPLAHVAGIPELNRHVTDEEYARVLRFAEQIGITNGYTQESSAAGKNFIPEFDGSGL